MEQSIEQAITLRDLCRTPTMLPRPDQIDGLISDALDLIQDPGKDVISGVSHCIRTPLTTLLGIRDIVERGLPLTEPQRESFLRIVLFESARLRRFIEMLTWYHETAAGMFSLSPYTADLRETLQRSVRSFDPEALNKSVRMVVSPPPSRVLVAADHDRLRHAFEQLLMNALHVSPGGGNIHITLEPHPESISIRISNTGPVLTREQSRSIFEPFVRVPHPHDTGSELGLGLTIVRSIVTAHGGTVVCEPWLRSGMSTTVSLPLK